MSKKKLTTEKIEQIIGKDKPGFVLDTDTDDEPLIAMASDSHVRKDAPDLAHLIAKFLNGAEADGSDQEEADSSGSSKIVRVRPASGSQASDAVGTGSRKVVVVSADDEAVVAEQG